jgi:hypothetical protein
MDSNPPEDCQGAAAAREVLVADAKLLRPSVRNLTEKTRTFFRLLLPTKGLHRDPLNAFPLRSDAWQLNNRITRFATAGSSESPTIPWCLSV